MIRWTGKDFRWVRDEGTLTAAEVAEVAAVRTTFRPPTPPPCPHCTRPIRTLIEPETVIEGGPPSCCNGCGGAVRETENHEFVPVFGPFEREAQAIVDAVRTAIANRTTDEGAT